MSEIKDPKTHILERLPARSTSGFTADEILKLVKIVDSYHDFKVAKRVKGSGGDEKAVVEAAAAVESGARSSPTSATAGAHFQIILNNLFNQTFLPKLDADTFFSNNGITKSSPEMSGRDFFERECGNMLHAALGGICIPTLVNCSEFVKPEFQMSSINSTGAIIVERDRAFEKTVDNNKIIGTKLLEWFFPTKGGKGGIGFCFDAQSAVLKDFMKPLNNKSEGFYCTQIVTPQNVLDSAGIGYDVLSAPAKDASFHFPTFTDGSTRTEYVVPTSNEFSNLFTEEFGKFSIQAGETFNPDTMNFEWVFTPEGKAPILMGKGPEDHRRNTGPGVPFLASMIDCVLTKKNHADLHACLDRRQTENDRMVSPVPALDALDEMLQGPNKKWILRLIYDIKRLGDHEQANSVYFYNSNPTNTYTAVFVTGDTLSALYSRMLGNPTVYIRTEDETKADSDKGSYLMCYRGIEKNIPPEIKARMDVENTLSQLNYYFSKITAFIGLASKSDLSALITNLETFKDAAPFTGEDGAMSNLFLKAKIYNSLEFLNSLTRKLEPLTGLLTTQKAALISKLPKIAGAKYENESLSITLNKDLTIEQLNQLNTYLLQSMTVLTPLMNSVISDLQYLNNFKVPSKDGDAVFSFHSTLFFSESKLETKLDTINYKKDDITFAISSISNFARRPVSGKRLQDSKDLISKYCENFLNSFFITKGYDKATWINSLAELMNEVTNETVKDIITGLFSQIVDLSIEASQGAADESIAAASDALQEFEKAVVEVRSAAAAEVIVAAPPAPPPLPPLRLQQLTREELQTKKLSELVAIASSKGIEIPTKLRSKGKMGEIIELILAPAAAPESSPETPTSPAALEPAPAAAVAAPPEAPSAAAPPQAPVAKEKVKAAEKKAKVAAKQAVEKLVPKVKEAVQQRPQTRHFLRQKEYVQKAVSEQLVSARMVTRLQAKTIAVKAEQSLLKQKSPLVPVKRQRASPRGGAEEDADNKLVQSMSTLFTAISNILLQINDYNAITLVPGSFVVSNQFYPHPMDVSQDAIVMRTGLTASELTQNKMKINGTTLSAYGGTRRHRKYNRKTRKLGGYYDLARTKGAGNFTISAYDTINQVEAVTEFFQYLKQYNKTLSGADSSKRRNILRERWYQFTSLLDAEGSPDLAESIEADKFSYDIRMLKSYVEFATNINETMVKPKPLGDLGTLTQEQVYQLLDPQETKRIGMNNIKAYAEVIEKNEAEKVIAKLDANATKNVMLCDYNIAMMKKQIEETKLLIELVGEEAPSTVPTEYQLGYIFEFEEEEPEEEEPEITLTILTEYLTSIEPAKGGGKRRRRTYKLRKRSNN